MLRIRLLFIALLAFGVTACGSPEERAAEHLARAQALLDEEDYVKAKLEAQNAAQIEPKNAEARLLLAKIAEQNQDYRDAVGHLLVAVDARPDSVDARVRLGLYYFLGRAEEQAVEQAEAAMELAPEDPRVRLLNARVLYLQGDSEAALAEARYSLKLDDSDPDAVMFLSGLHAEAEDFDRAFETLDAGIERLPVDKVQALQQFRLQLLARAGRFDEVEEGLVRLTRDYPDEESYKYALAQYYTQNERPAEAEALVRDLIRLDPADSERRINLVRLLISQDRPADAERALDEFIAERPEDLVLRLARASLYENQGRGDESRAELQAVADLDPKGEEGLRARNLLATLAIRNGELEEARARTDAILEDAPDNADALLARAAFEFTEGNNDAAIRDLRLVLRKEENSERALLLLARSYVRNGDGTLAQDTYRRLLGINPQHPTAPRELAALLANQGDTAEAQDVLQARLEVEPGDTEAAAGLIQTMLALDDIAAAEAEARKLVDLNQNNALAQLQLGRVLQAKGSAAEAVAAYKATLAESPGATAALQGLISVWTQNDQADEAIDYLQGYIADNPEVPEARLLLGAVHVQKGDYELAEAEFEATLEARPRAIRAWIALAALFPANSEKREEVYLRGLEAMPGEPQLSLLLASQYERQQRMEDAMAIYESMLESNPENIIAINNLAALMLDFRDDPESRKRALELAKKLESTNQPPFLDTLGWAYYRNGDYFSAVRFLERAVAGAGQVPILRYHLGMAYAAAENPVGARQELSQALEAATSDFVGIEEAREKLAELSAS